MKHVFVSFHFLFVWICSHSFLSQGNQPNAKLCSRCQFRQNAKLCSQYGMQMSKLCWRCKLWHCPLHCTTNQACSARHVKICEMPSYVHNGKQMPKLCWRCKLLHCPQHCTTNQALSRQWFLGVLSFQILYHRCQHPRVCQRPPQAKYSQGQKGRSSESSSTRHFSSRLPCSFSHRPWLVDLRKKFLSRLRKHSICFGSGSSELHTLCKSNSCSAFHRSLM